jgi:hypothetical protein
MVQKLYLYKKRLDRKNFLHLTQFQDNLDIHIY